MHFPNKFIQIIKKYNITKTLEPNSPLSKRWTSPPPSLQRSFPFLAVLSNAKRGSFAVNFSLHSCLKTKLCRKPLTLSRRHLCCHLINQGNFRNYRLCLVEYY